MYLCMYVRTYDIKIPNIFRYIEGKLNVTTLPKIIFFSSLRGIEFDLNFIVF